ncbi:serine/threonine-protein kinase [Actinomadura rubrisoli]|uniref:Serine/threonine protein kinase n=1 Tax=Actinomadura rubrisoli TaxID=2530368 RepID=A0A4R5B240_9ACTN|nr:serine/threonine-protein kinase [Actinomadura rubrisoli]TDD79761.1 serine/threonine protein kinase [Actinomadura rubrisoli]
MAPWRISGFDEVRELGSGAQGRVVLARHAGTGSPVAIKYVHRRPGDEAAIELLRAEAVMLGRITDPHVTRLYQFVSGEHGAAIVMEAVNGVTLKAVLAEHGRLEPEAALVVLKGSLLGLAAAHELGVVHRDYKPANVVVQGDGLSKLIDFGVAAVAGEGSRTGTPAYMSPEQWEGRPASPSSDVYAATCVFFECVTGHRPFPAADAPGLRHRHLSEPVPVEELPEPLRPLVAAGMAKDPRSRPPSAGAFLTALEAAASEAYGADWEHRGVRTLAAGTAALAALFPLGGLIAQGIAGGAAVTAQTGLLATTGAKITAAALGSALAVGAGTAGTVAVQRATAEPAPKPSFTNAAVVVPVRSCRFNDQTSAPSRVRLPSEVRLPARAAVYQVPFQGVRFIGPAGRNCTGSGGSGVGVAGVKGVEVTLYVDGYECGYFPDSDEAAYVRRTEPQNCGSPQKASAREDVPTGRPGLLAYLMTGGPTTRRAGGEVSLVMHTSWRSGRSDSGLLITCFLPRGDADICAAALTHRLDEIMRPRGVPQTALDRAARQIARYVDTHLR